jgi:hypothetical protein
MDSKVLGEDALNSQSKTLTPVDWQSPASVYPTMSFFANDGIAFARDNVGYRLMMNRD